MKKGPTRVFCADCKWPDEDLERCKHPDRIWTARDNVRGDRSHYAHCDWVCGNDRGNCKYYEPHENAKPRPVDPPFKPTLEDRIWNIFWLGAIYDEYGYKDFSDIQ